MRYCTRRGIPRRGRCSRHPPQAPTASEKRVSVSVYYEGSRVSFESYDERRHAPQDHTLLPQAPHNHAYDGMPPPSSAHAVTAPST